MIIGTGYNIHFNYYSSYSYYMNTNLTNYTHVIRNTDSFYEHSEDPPGTKLRGELCALITEFTLKLNS